MPLSDSDFEAWQLDSSRNAFRVMLIEADYDGGTVRLASKPWVSNAHLSYDDWLVSLPYMESVVDDVGGIGDFEAINRDAVADDWNTHVWHGQECRWYFGDMSWSQEDFRTIGRSLIDGVRALGRYVFRFELMDQGQALKRSLVTADATRIEDVDAAIEWLVSTTGVTISVVNVPDSKLSWALSYDVTPTTQGIDILKAIARSINARISVDQNGNVELMVFNPDAALEINTDGIGADRLTASEIIPPYVNVTVIKSDGTRVSDTTGVVTGTVVEETDIDTYLTDTGNANTLLSEYISYHANAHKVWSIPVTTMAGLMRTGSAVTIVHPELTVTGMVSRVYRSPLSSATDIEVET